MFNTPNVLKESSRGYQALQLSDLHFQERKIFFTSDVNTESTTALIQQLLYLEQESNEEILLYLNSPGGCVSDGLAVYDTIRLMKSPVTTIAAGTVASMGAILFLAADKRIILHHSHLMLHDPSYSSGSYAGKKPDELQSELDSLVKTREQLTKIIAERTGKPEKIVLEKTCTDSYFDAKEALEFGLATDILTQLV